jgi:hypothetical protein
MNIKAEGFTIDERYLSDKKFIEDFHLMWDFFPEPVRLI